jgi:predicted aspartyl protease
VEPSWGEGLAEIIGHVDGRNRLLVSLPVPDSDDNVLVAIDTGFNKELLIDRAHVGRFKCELTEVAEQVEIADHTRHSFVLAHGQIVWFGRLREVDILVPPTARPRALLADEPVGLLGTGLLTPHKLMVDFATRRVVITENED